MPLYNPTSSGALDSDLVALANQAGTNTFPVRTGAGTISEKDYIEGSYVPIITLVGGAGNVVPQYVTNQGKYTKVGNRVFISIFLANDGGNEGAGTGQIYISLPYASGAALTITSSDCFVNNGLQQYFGFAALPSGANTILLYYFDTISTIAPVQGSQQTDSARQLIANISYEI